MKVTDGALTPEFQTLRLPLGTGLLGPGRADGRAVLHRGLPGRTSGSCTAGYIDEAVAGEQIRAILGVPAGPRRRGDRRPPRGAPLRAPLPAVGGQPADLLRGARGGRAGERPPVRRARRGQPLPHPAHRRPSTPPRSPTTGSPTCCIGGGGVAEVAEVLAGVLDGAVSVWTPTGELLAGDDAPQARPDAVPEAVAEAVTSGRSVATGSGLVAAALARTEHVATLVLRRRRSRSTSPSVARSSAERWSPRWSCSSPAPSPRPRSASAASSSPTCSESDPDSRERLRDRVRRHSASLDGRRGGRRRHGATAPDRHRASRAAVALARRSSRPRRRAPRRRGRARCRATTPPASGRTCRRPWPSSGRVATVGVAGTSDALHATGWSRPTTRRAAASTRCVRLGPHAAR